MRWETTWKAYWRIRHNVLRDNLKGLLRCDESSADFRAVPFDQDLWYNVGFLKKGVRLGHWRQILDCILCLNIIKSKRCTKYNLAFCSRLVAKSRCTSVASRVQSESWCSASYSFYQQMWDCIRVAQKYNWPFLCKSHMNTQHIAHTTWEHRPPMGQWPQAAISGLLHCGQHVKTAQT